MSFSPQIQGILQIIKHLFDLVVKALAEVRDVQEKVQDKCLLLPPQPKLSGAGEETSLSPQPFAASAHRSLSCHLPSCLYRSWKSEGTCQALSVMDCD